MLANRQNSAFGFAAKAALLLVLGAGSLRAQTATVPLAPGPATEHQLRGGGADTYSVALKAGEFVHIVAQQRGIDVVVSLFSPKSELLVSVDSLNGRFGAEPLFWVATEDGDYGVKVASLNAHAKAGAYTIRIEDLRAAVPDDQMRLAGQKALVDGAALMFSQGTADALRQAVTDFKSAYTQWDHANDSERKVASLAFLVEAYDELTSAEHGEHQAAPAVAWGDDLKFLQKEADAGDASAQSALGDVYDDGLGVPQDYAAAMKWKRKAADQNREEAQSAVGFFYFHSVGVKQDFTEAAKWFIKAANNGYVPAEIQLADMYVNAQGVKQNLGAARQWYQAAADAGSQLAADRLAALMKAVASQ
jgi:hypothetical protein